MAWVISRDDQGGIFSFSSRISLIALIIQITRSFAFIFLLMIIWRNNLFSTQHCACAFPHFVRSAPVCDGPVGSTAGSCEVLHGVLLSPEDQTVEAAGQPSVFGTTCTGLDWCSFSGEWEADIFSVCWWLSCLLSCRAPLLPSSCAVLMPWDLCQKLFQTVLWVGAGEMCQHTSSPWTPRMTVRVCFLRGGTEISLRWWWPLLQGHSWGSPRTAAFWADFRQFSLTWCPCQQPLLWNEKSLLPWARGFHRELPRFLPSFFPRGGDFFFLHLLFYILKLRCNQKILF